MPQHSVPPNAPCPLCGSGRKYKKCCGLLSVLRCNEAARRPAAASMGETKAMMEALGLKEMPQGVAEVVAGVQRERAANVDWETCVSHLVRTSGTALRAVSREATEGRGGVEDGVGVVATRTLGKGEEVMACGWPEQTSAEPRGLRIVSDAQLDAAQVPAWLVSNMRRRFYRDDARGRQAVPTSARVFMSHAMEQYVNEARDGECANVAIDAASSSYTLTREVPAGGELLYPPGRACAFRPGAGADASAVEDDDAAHRVLSWTKRFSYAPTIIAASEVEGVGIMAAAPIARKAVHPISVNQAQELEETGQRRIATVTHAAFREKIAHVSEEVRRNIIYEVRRRFGFDATNVTIPVVGGLNRITTAQIVNHSASPPMTSKVSDGKLRFLFVRPVEAGEELTENYEGEVSTAYFDWAVRGGPPPAGLA